MNISALARPEVRKLVAYVPAVYAPGLVRLNANEAPWRTDGDQCQRPLNHYPEARPSSLTELLADHYGQASAETLVTRGTSEAIDLLIRCFCRPGLDEIVICPPTFGMYEVYADIQNAPVVRVPLLGPDMALPVDDILVRWRGTTRLVFVTTPNNPTGHSLALKDIERLIDGIGPRGLVVIDAAYVEFADAAAVMALRLHPQVVVLRTLSKAYGLAGARCGAVLADPAVIDLLQKVMPPYAVPTPSVEQAMQSLATESFSIMPERIATLVRERQRVATALAKLSAVVRVWPSDANFLLVTFTDAGAALAAAERAGVLLRDFSARPETPGALRITIGAPAINDALLARLEELDA